ncbi:SDR family oxidoreductase [Pseudomonadota bacterium]|jgi:NAD(P)-dependent dehydrogenase (short-subunit alcohol dehydrogenase family)|nr:SDR family oxidoreductase [Pseudomonadota bacterium]MDA9660103.1 SDR family oxidoreductase [Pseudomonadota bacterium]|tara:strand:+ start:601 stop:1368 length:768 start_codon:yes stop_codon:yes gene_type:complete
MTDSNFKKGCVLIVGGSGGIGSLCAKEFANSGAKLAITYYKNEQAAIDIANEINADVKIYQLDNSNSKSVDSTFKNVIKDHGSINTLVNAAGFDIPQKFIGEIDVDLWKGVIDADINGFFNLIKFGLPYLRKSKGSIVFISSAGLFKYPPGDILSVAPKATIEHVLKGIAKEEGVNGVRANSIALGIIETGIFHRLREEENTFFDDAWHEAVMNTLAIKRFGLPKEVADTAVFLASSKGGYITGHCIPVDGGYHL